MPAATASAIACVLPDWDQYTTDTLLIFLLLSYSDSQLFLPTVDFKNFF